MENLSKFRESTKKLGKKFAKESFDDMEKEFTYKGVTITRYDYESLPSPMAASQLDDKTMQRIAYDIYDYLSSAGWGDDEIAKYLGSNLDEVLDDDWKGEQIKDEFWQYMEKAAIKNGMKYYEDMPEGEYVDESSKKFGKKFKESAMEPEDKFEEKYQNFIVALEKYGSHGQVHMFGPENMYVSIPRLGIKDVYDEVDKIRMAAEEVGWSIPPDGDIEKSIMNDRRTAAEIAIIPAEEDLTGEYDESTKRFGKKFRKMDESMNWDGVTDKFLDNDKVQFTRKCPSCGKPHSITVSIRDVEDGCYEYGKGARIQDAFPNFSPDEREFFMTGICPDCWENM